MTYETVSFFSDLGHGDENVGLAHSIIREVAPSTSVVDLCHSIGLGDTRSAALMIARSVPYLAPGIVLAVIDHGMDRPPIAVEVGDGQAVLVGPDSGVLGAAVAVVGGAQRAVRLTSDQYRIPSPGAIHEGRDVLAPAAAHLAAGVRLEDLGDLIDPAALVPSLVPVHGQAPDAWRDLPDPQAIFVGGSGRMVPDLVAAALTRLGDGGRIVVNVSSPDNLVEVQAKIEAGRLRSDVRMINIARSQYQLDRVRFDALNPTFLVLGRK
jgi:hypothetical protein